MNMEACHTRYEILDVPVDAVDLDGALSIVGGWLASPPGGLQHLVTVNPEFVIAARRDPAFAAVLRRAALSTADGVGITIAARMLSLPRHQRVTGVDLVEGLAGSNLDNCRIFLLGAAEGVAAEAAAVLGQRYPGVCIAGTFSGSPAPGAFPEVQKKLADSRPTVLLVAFGHPAQDLWIDAHRERLREHGILIAAGVGGAFDYLSGRVPRAPRVARRLGLEWLYRLVRQPWRWRRQLALPQFVMLVLRERIRQRHRNTLESS